MLGILKKIVGLPFEALDAAERAIQPPVVTHTGANIFETADNTRPTATSYGTSVGAGGQFQHVNNSGLHVRPTVVTADVNAQNTMDPQNNVSNPIDGDENAVAVMGSNYFQPSRLRGLQGSQYDDQNTSFLRNLIRFR